MKYLLVAGEVTVAIGIGLVCIALIAARRAAATRAEQTVSNPILLPEFRHDSGADRPTRSSRP